MTYDQLEINSKIRIREKPDNEKSPSRLVKYTVIAKYPSMCVLEDGEGRRRGVSIGELIMNKIITQAPYFEKLRSEKHNGWRKKSKKHDTTYAL
ncbi:MAG: hypothetical protein K2L86_13055 [Lachnospiraceae bacterium]|nr:hypothetical protein [Lachnospiraceae bacterium]